MNTTENRKSFLFRSEKLDSTTDRTAEGFHTVVLEAVGRLGLDPVEPQIGEIEPSSDLHGSSEYRRHVAGVLVRRALTIAGRRAAAA